MADQDRAWLIAHVTERWLYETSQRCRDVIQDMAKIVLKEEGAPPFYVILERAKRVVSDFEHRVRHSMFVSMFF